MKANGYTTGMFGKWAGGYEGSVSTPKTRGIDEYYGYICQYMAHRYFPNFLNRYSPRRGDKDVIRITMDENVKYSDGCTNPDYAKRTQYSGDMIHQEALEWLDLQTKDKPFYGLFTYTLPHAELYQPNDSILQAYYGKFCNDKTFGGTDRYHATINTHAQFAAMITRLESQHVVVNTTRLYMSWPTYNEGDANATFVARTLFALQLTIATKEVGVSTTFLVRTIV